MLFVLGDVYQAGKANITDTSQNKHGCQSVSFKTQFQGSGDVKVFVTLSHGNKYIKIHDPAALWVKSVSTSGFKVCVREAGSGSGGKSVINWLAFQGSHQGIKSGIVDFDEWTTRTQCKRVSIIDNHSSGFKNKPQVFITVQHKHADRPYDSMNLWLEGVSKNEFYVCMREFMTFDGIHSDLKVHWFAYDVLPSNWNFTEEGKIHFAGNGAPLRKNSYAFCQEVSRSAFKVCLKDSQGISKTHNPVTVKYAIIGDLDPCINVTCDYFAVCKAFDAFDARCVCEENCPSYEEQVCSSNSTTFKNKCIFELEMCRLKSNHTLYHPGSCTGFPVQRGRVELKRDVSWAETACELVTFPPFSFYPDKEVHVQITTNHWNSTRRNFVHEATVSWVENVNFQNFRVCATAAGRNDRGTKEFTTLDWMAYQELQMEDKFAATPFILATADHVSSAYKHDAASLWIENATSSTFHICLRELQNYDGLHEDILVNWMAFEEIHRPLFTESRKIDFPNNKSVSANYNGAFCKDVQFVKTYYKEPTHIKTSEFRICLKELFADQHDPVTVSYVVLADVCKPGWSYFSGFCYSTSQSCKNWTEAQKACQLYNTSLITVKDQEENVYIQHRLNGDKGWIGFNDRDTEGTFVWAGNQSSNFTYWAPRQPNDFKLNEDCVHTLGVGHKFTWNDVDYLDECTGNNHDCDKNNGICTNTQGSFNCHCAGGFKGDGRNCTDIDECSSGHGCHGNATCKNTVGSYTCACNNGYTGDGITCTGSYGYSYSSTAFIFSLKNYYGYGYFKKNIYSGYRRYATYSYYYYGPTFGHGHDIYVANNANSNYNSYFNGCNTYGGSYCNNNLWTGSRNFCADEIEVFYETTS
ncbi:Fibrillin-1 [Stylophora pistillata]|uniref:Fibrillin-1 n=1 Tax=Stylophora pistillata TaxID=50429 RepID=A0A2B4REJ4_STYPI|nr:Fibrillin-1 [Stylophora pistillata]